MIGLASRPWPGAKKTAERPDRDPDVQPSALNPTGWPVHTVTMRSEPNYSVARVDRARDVLGFTARLHPGVA